MITIFSRPVSCFLFDLDGTLVKTHIDFDLMRQTVSRLANEAGAELSNETNTNILESAKIAAESLGSAEGPILWNRTMAALEEIEAQGCANPEEIPGASELLIYLRECGIKIGIVTRNCRRVSVPLLAGFALPYDVLLTRDDVTKTKPDPAHLQDALDILGCDPNESAMVGDHWLDIQAGKAERCALTIGVLGDRDSSWFDNCKPDIIVKDLRETMTVLGRCLPERSEGSLG